jgi:hypothetical protein
MHVIRIQTHMEVYNNSIETALYTEFKGLQKLVTDSKAAALTLIHYSDPPVGARSRKDNPVRFIDEDIRDRVSIDLRTLKFKWSELDKAMQALIRNTTNPVSVDILDLIFLSQLNSPSLIRSAYLFSDLTLDLVTKWSAFKRLFNDYVDHVHPYDARISTMTLRRAYSLCTKTTTNLMTELYGRLGTIDSLISDMIDVVSTV